MGTACCPFCHQKNFTGQTCLSCQKTTYLDGCTSLGLYHDPVLRGLIHSWKFNHDLSTGQLIKDWLRQFPLEQILPPVSWFVSAVPLHQARQRERGFNQAEEVALVLAEELKEKYLNLLERVEWTDSQAQRKREERMIGDLDGIFTTVGLVPPNVLLCDDVLTSGTTMEAAAKTLKEAGAQTVWGFTLARAES